MEFYLENTSHVLFNDLVILSCAHMIYPKSGQIIIRKISLIHV